MGLSRREVLTWSAVGTGAVAFGNMGSLLAASPAVAAAPSIGEPVLDPAGILDLPAGFSYQVVSRAGDPLPEGGITPGRHDGTAVIRRPPWWRPARPEPRDRHQRSEPDAWLRRS